MADGELADQAPPVNTKRSRGATERPSASEAQQRGRGAAGRPYSDVQTDEPGQWQDQQNGYGSRRVESPKGDGLNRQKGLPTPVLIGIAGFIFCAFAGGTFFFLTKPPENERLLQDGQKQLGNGQYAFALKTLGQAAKVKPNDPRVLLALARAYVGVDQVDKAWECITQAQQLGAGVIADPALASELANYYRQHNQFQRSIELLRPLAAQNIAGKKAELSDLDAAWGDDSIRDGDLKQAMHCWEEVKDLHEGSRASEAESRLSTIYTKIAEQMAVKGDTEEALKYYTKLNATAPSAPSYERAADLYQKQGNLELAIDQMNKAVKMTADPSILNRKLSSMMAARGKELIEKGETDAGYGFLQKAQGLDPHTKVPTATIRNTHLESDKDGLVHFNGEVWNPGPEPVGTLTIRAELFDTKEAKIVWTKDLKVIDEFVPPLAPHDSHPFELVSTVPPAEGSSTDLRIFLNNSLYKSYPLSNKSGATASAKGNSAAGDSGLKLAPRIQPPAQKEPPVAPAVVPAEGNMPAVAPNAGGGVPTPGGSPEEKTLKDLD